MNDVRIVRPSWDESFMGAAYWASMRSSCKYLQTGAVIVKDKRVIASGYNGAPPNIDNCLNRGCRKDDEGVDFQEKGKGVCRGTHAEINAMNQIARKDLADSILYSVYFPCSSCAKAIVGADISEVVYARIYKEVDSLTSELFSEAGVKLRKMNFGLEDMIKFLKNLRK